MVSPKISLRFTQHINAKIGHLSPIFGDSGSRLSSVSSGGSSEPGNYRQKDVIGAQTGPGRRDYYEHVPVTSADPLGFSLLMPVLRRHFPPLC
jgi:hypothetical protein